MIDEVSMGHKHVFEAIDRTLRFVREEEDKLFGGLNVLFAADWRQCLPVVPRGSRGTIVHACLKSSYIWPLVHGLTLSINMRVQQTGNNVEFSRYLDQCGDGRLERIDGKFQVRILEKFQFRGELDELCNWVFEDVERNSRTVDWVSSRAIICPTNKTVDMINTKMVTKFPGDPHLYRSFDSLEEDEHLFPMEFINTLTPSGVPPHELLLKVGAPIMLMRNFNPYEGHCNGTKYIITRLHTRIIEARIASGPYKNNVLLIPRIKIKPSEKAFPFVMTRKQFPVRPCFAITSNKSQGQTLKRVGLYLDRDFFSHGSYYVGQSRVGDENELKVLSRDGLTTQNVVYSEVLG